MIEIDKGVGKAAVVEIRIVRLSGRGRRIGGRHRGDVCHKGALIPLLKSWMGFNEFQLVHLF